MLETTEHNGLVLERQRHVTEVLPVRRIVETLGVPEEGQGHRIFCQQPILTGQRVSRTSSPVSAAGTPFSWLPASDWVKPPACSDLQQTAARGASALAWHRDSRG
jgi:hypothetical protein